MKYVLRPHITASFSESIIAKQLKDNGIPFKQEVEFEGCINPKTKHALRFDFWLHKHNTLIEYDGKDFHKDADVRHRDRIKTEFAKAHGFRLIRVQGISNIAKLFNNELNITIKKPVTVEKLVPKKGYWKQHKMSKKAKKKAKIERERQLIEHPNGILPIKQLNKRQSEIVKSMIAMRRDNSEQYEKEISRLRKEDRNTYWKVIRAVAA